MRGKKNLSTSLTEDTQKPFSVASEAVTALVKNVIIRLEALEKSTLPDDLFDVYSFHSQQLL